MKRFVAAMSGVILALGASGMALAAGADRQQSPRLLGKIAGGLWEVDQVGRDGAPRRICVSDVSRLAQYEHLGMQCTRVTVSEDRTSAQIRYTCTSGGFGTSRIEVVTPRSLRINTQGIYRGQPFNRTLLARRAGAC